MEYGFNNTVKTEWIEGCPQDMMILEDVSFCDANRMVWTAPAGIIVDGASIPRICWTLIGSPFVGFYRRASVIHDAYCKAQTVPWQYVHKCFFDMMLFDYVAPAKAIAMYAAVYKFGPRWELNWTGQLKWELNRARQLKRQRNKVEWAN